MHQRAGEEPEVRSFERPCPHYVPGPPKRCKTMRDCPSGVDCPPEVRARRKKTKQTELI